MGPGRMPGRAGCTQIGRLRRQGLDWLITMGCPLRRPECCTLLFPRRTVGSHSKHQMHTKVVRTSVVPCPRPHRRTLLLAMDFVSVRAILWLALSRDNGVASLFDRIHVGSSRWPNRLALDLYRRRERRPTAHQIAWAHSTAKADNRQCPTPSERGKGTQPTTSWS